MLYRNEGFTRVLGLASGLFLITACDGGPGSEVAMDSSTGSSTPGFDASTSGDTTSMTDATTSDWTSSSGDSTQPTDSTDETTETDEPIVGYPLRVRVTLDGEVPGKVVLKQGGVDRHYWTTDQGFAVIGVDLGLVGEVVVHASHPEARIGKARIEVEDPPAEVEINLVRYDASDNEDYEFFPPGTPDDLLYCAHCHHRINESWYHSPHRTSASNLFVQDMYAGVVSAIHDESECNAVGGHWWYGRIPGTTEKGYRCYLGAGALPDLNDDCGHGSPCDDKATNFGQCANCHAPGINGKLGDRDLLDATGVAYENGVHCDVCHKVESLNLDGEPGVGGNLQIMRPSETPGLPGEKYKPLVFGPFHDVSQVAMGAVQRDHFSKPEFCAGCHDYGVDVHPRWGTLDPIRWPEGKLPVQSTFQEWEAGPLNPSAPCISCHMPPYSDVWNAAGLEKNPGLEPGTIGGWVRPPGSVRQHSWVGPRQPESQMLQLAAAVTLDVEQRDGRVEVQATVKNVGPGHAIPTGLPARSMILLVRAQCGALELDSIGGDTVPAFGGWIAQKSEGENWKNWPNARAGQVIRVVRDTGQWVDYHGYGPFGDGRFSPVEKGLPKLEVVSESTIVRVDADGNVELDTPLGKGDIAYLGQSAQFAKGPPRALAGAPGFAFARVLVDKDGTQNVPSFRAIDILSDNRILPQESFTTTHVFKSTCDDPVVHAALLYRSFPIELVRERKWDRDDVVMTEAVR